MLYADFHCCSVKMLPSRRVYRTVSDCNRNADKTNLKATPSARGWRCRWSQRHKAGQRKLGTEVIEKDCQTRQLCKEDAMDHVTHCINHGKRSANKGGRSG